MSAALSLDALRERALGLGLELVGIVRAQDLEDALGGGQAQARFRALLRGELAAGALSEEAVRQGVRPHEVSDRLGTVVVVGKRLHAGISISKDRGLRRLAAGNLANRLDHATARLGYTIERAGGLAMLVPALHVEWGREDATFNAPAGQGSVWARTAAVLAGLGTWGLNDMVLTPEFGPRVYFSTLLTDLELPPGAPLDEELCPGLEACGKCAQICPAKAIPSQAPPGATLHQVRGLDGAACARCSQPYGPDAFVGFLKRMLETDGEARRALIEGPEAHEHWQSMAIGKFGAYTGCIDCLTVCPVGADRARLDGPA